MSNKTIPDANTRACLSCSKLIPQDSKRCPYCEVVVKWTLNGKLRPKWQVTMMLGPILLVDPLKKGCFKETLVKCEVDWDTITLYMGDGTTHKLRRGEYKGTWLHVGSIPITDVSRWQLFITPVGGKQIGIDTLLAQYPNGQKSVEELIDVLGLEKSKLSLLNKAGDILKSFKSP